MENKFPGNTYSDIKPAENPPAKEEKKVVAKGRVVQTKKSFGEKIAETFMSVDLGSAASHIFTDVLVPAIKDTFVDTIEGLINLIVYGDRDARRSYKKPKAGAYISYDSIGSEKDRNGRSGAAKGKYWSSLKAIYFDTAREAMDVLEELRFYIREYELVTVQKYYEICDAEPTYTDVSYGWYNLDNVDIVRVKEYGYILKLPRPVVIDG